MDRKPILWIVGHCHDRQGRLVLRSARVADRAGHLPEEYQAALDAAQASLPPDMLGCTHKVLARSASLATERFTDFAFDYCTHGAHGRPAARMVPSA